MSEGLNPLYVCGRNEKKPSEIFGEISIHSTKDGHIDNGNNESGNKVDVNSEAGNTVQEDTNTGYTGAKNSDEGGKAGNNTDVNYGNTNDNNISNSVIGNGTGTSQNSNGSTGSGYKLYAILGIVFLCLLVSLLLYIKKKHWKNYLFVGILGFIGVMVILFTDFSSPEEYYGKTTDKSNVIGTVTMSIRCDILKGKKLKDHIPEDFCILDTTEFKLEEGETVYDILLEAAKEYSISVEHEGSSDIVYISGINYLYENDYGDLSGWVYKVNGELPSVGCGGYTLKPGDKIEWCYTLDLGNDVTKASP